MMISRGVPQGATFAFDVASHSLDEQLRRVDALDSKAGVLLAADGIIASLILGRTVPSPAQPVWVTLPAGLAVLLSMGSALVAFSNRNYETALEPGAIAEVAAAPEAWIRWRFISNMIDAVDTNRIKIDQKARWLTCGQLSLLAGLALLGGYFAYASLSGGGEWERSWNAPQARTNSSSSRSSFRDRSRGGRIRSKAWGGGSID